MPAEADAELADQALIPSESRRHVDAASGLVLQHHVGDDLLEAGIALRFPAQPGAQLPSDQMLQRNENRILLADGVAPAGEALLL